MGHALMFACFFRNGSNGLVALLIFALPLNLNNMKKRLITVCIIIYFSACYIVQAQTPQKIINTQYQSWFSINSTVRLKNKWGFVADVHERRNDFISKPYFHFARVGINYWLKDNITLTAGYAHLWLSPTVSGWHTYANENRIYEQAQIVTKINKVIVLQRLRIEQRWQQKIVNNEATHNNKFTDRFRYLLSFTVPVVKNLKYPSLVISDELCVQFGKEIVYNTFDQNRLFVGLKQTINKALNFDMGYIMLYQQKPAALQYDKSHIFRWFFYYTPDLRKKNIAKTT